MLTTGKAWSVGVDLGLEVATDHKGLVAKRQGDGPGCTELKIRELTLLESPFPVLPGLPLLHREPRPAIWCLWENQPEASSPG